MNWSNLSVFHTDVNLSSSTVQDDDDLVISGVSCRLPESDNMQELWDNLMAGVDMVTEDDRRWPPGQKADFVMLYMFLVY